MLFSFDGRVPSTGDDTYVSETAQVIGDVRIGNSCYVGHGAILRGDYGTILVGDESVIEEGVVVHAPPGERCAIGNRVVVGHGAIVHARSIGDSVTIGMGAILSIRSEVGSRSIVAEGAVVKQEQQVAASVVVAGNPSKKVRDSTKDDMDRQNYSVELYAGLAKKYLSIGMHRT
ncbi:MAG TPA: gamma carbonic anhydrase family protein [Syntrophorhabdales bacterium]|nr:gamma carbonic anhydrase family protein [Syntrophorhabdales bacterium]